MGAFDAAVSAPMPGCRMNQGATIVPQPTSRGGQTVGDEAQPSPQIASSRRQADVDPEESDA
jgi:hypothetical protein